VVRCYGFGSVQSVSRRSRGLDWRPLALRGPSLAEHRTRRYNRMPQFGIVYVDFTAAAAAAASDRLQSLTRYVTIGPTAYFTEMTGHLSPRTFDPRKLGGTADARLPGDIRLRTDVMKLTGGGLALLFFIIQVPVGIARTVHATHASFLLASFLSLLFLHSITAHYRATVSRADASSQSEASVVMVTRLPPCRRSVTPPCSRQLRLG